MFILMVVIFVLGYLAIALEHPLKIDKAASALLIGSLTWVAFIIGAEDILLSGVSATWNAFLHEQQILAAAAGTTFEVTHETYLDFIVHNQIIEHLGEISEILFFLLGAMTIVEIIDHHQGFKLVTDSIKTTSKVKLLWIISFLTFFMSATLDNLTTTIVMVTLLKKLIADKQTRWFFASMVVLAANAGGAWSPIGDVTTIMLWIGGQITAVNIILMVFIPSLITMVIPMILLSFTMKGNVTRPKLSSKDSVEYTTLSERKLMLFVGVGALLFVPVFKTITHLPPYMGMLLGLGVLWVMTDIMHRKKPYEDKGRLTVTGVIKKVDIPTVLFFLGILSAVASLQTAGQLGLVSIWLDQVTNNNIYIINTAIGLLSSVVDNVPLVAGAMGMYPLAEAGHFAVDGIFWELLAFTAGTGGSILIIGSAAGVAAMALEKIDFIWYMKKISLLALLGYFAGIAAYYFQELLLGNL
ncbi:MAG: sodium:proton antiporter NhaD [Bacteroidetes bacterium]|nr:sodium:proton antiporter NhaD [Bacteroidota bacterium]